MTLEKTIKSTVLQRIKRVVLGKEKPNLLTRVSVIVGFIVWLYLFSWHLINALSILLLGNLEESGKIRAAYNALGTQKYAYSDTINRLLVHSTVQIAIFGAILFSLILIWRKKKLGFIIYVVSSILGILIAFVLMGFKYLSLEVPALYFVLVGITTVYFSIGLFIFYGNKEVEPVLSDSDH